MPGSAHASRAYEIYSEAKNKCSEHEAEHTPPPQVEVKSMCCSTSIPPYTLMA